MAKDRTWQIKSCILNYVQYIEKKLKTAFRKQHLEVFIFSHAETFYLVPRYNRSSEDESIAHGEMCGPND